MTKIFDCPQEQIRYIRREKLVLPDMPKHLDKYDKCTLVKILEHLVDYWANWYGKASFLPENVEFRFYKITTLRRLIKSLMSSNARNLFKLDPKKPHLWESHIKPLFKEWEKIVSKEYKDATKAMSKEWKIAYGDLMSKM